MGSIDNRVVKMDFENEKFQKGVSSTLDALGSLDSTINNMSGASLDGMSKGIDEINSKFSILGGIGFSALSRVTDYAIDSGINMAKGFWDPIAEGGKKRALNIEQAKFQFEGLGMDVEASMKSAKDAVSGTAYGLDEAAKIAGILGTSGMQAGDQMTAALRGIAGTAAMSGASFMDIGDIFTDVFAKGRVQAEDFNRLSARGVSGTAVLAEHLGVTQEEVLNLSRKGKISADTFADAMNNAFGEHATKANQTYTGSLSNMRAAMSRVGAEFATIKFKDQIPVNNALAGTFDALKDTLKPVVDLYGEFSAFKSNAQVSFWNKVTSVIKDLAQPLELIVQSIRNVVKAIAALISPIKNAFSSVFNFSGAGNVLVTILTNAAAFLEKFTSALIINENTVNNITKVFTFLFNIIKFGFNVIKFIGQQIVKLDSIISSLAKQIWDAAQPIRDFFSQFKSDITSDASKAFSDFGNTVSSIASGPIEEAGNAIRDFIQPKYIASVEWLSDVLDKLRETFKKVADVAGKAWSSVRDGASNSGDIAAKAKSFLDKLVDGIKTAFEYFGTFASSAADVIRAVGESFAGFFEGFNIGTLISGLNGAAFAGILLSLYQMFDAFKGVGENIEGMFGSIKDVADKAAGTLDTVTKSITTMQKDVKASILLKIAAAIALLAGSIWLLAQVEPKKLMAATGAMAALILVFIGSMGLLMKVIDPKKMLMLGKVSMLLLALSFAMLILTKAMTELAKLDWNGIAKGLVGLAGSLGILLGAIAIMNMKQLSKDVSKTAFTLVILAAAMWLLSKPIQTLGQMSWSELAKGLGAFVIILGSLVGALYVIGLAEGSLLAGAFAMGVMAFAIGLVAAEIMVMAAIDWVTFLDGFTKFLLILAALTISMAILGTFAPQLVGVGFALIGMAIAIAVMVAAVYLLGSMDIGTLIQGLIALIIMLAALTLAAMLMAGATIGAVAMVAMAFAILILAAAVWALGSMPFDVMIQGIFGFALILGVLIGAAYLAQGAAVGLGLIVGVALALGVASILVAIGLLIFAAALSAMGPAMTIAAAGLRQLASAAKDSWGAILPLIGLAAGVGALGLALIIAGAGALLLGLGFIAMGVGLSMLAVSAVPGALALKQLLDTFGMWDMGKMLALGAAVAVLGAGMLVLGIGSLLSALGMGLFVIVMALFIVLELLFTPAMNRIGSAIEKLNGKVETLNSITTAFDAFGKSLSTAEKSANRLAIALMMINVSTSQGTKNIKSFNTALMLLPMGIGLASTAVRGEFQKMSVIVMLAMTMMTTNFTGQSNTFISQVKRLSQDVGKAFGSMGSTISNSSGDIISGAEGLMTSLTVYMTIAISSLKSKMNNRGYEVGTNIIQGMAKGVTDHQYLVTTASTDVATKALKAARKTLEIQSPSKKMYYVGEMFDAGFAKGIEKKSGSVETASNSLGSLALQTVSSTISKISQVLSGNLDFNPTITPVLDLSEVQNQASSLNGILDPGALSYTPNMNAASRGYQDNLDQKLLNALEDAEAKSNSFNYTQINQSPRSLSEAEIYRQTKNQLATVRKAFS